MIRPEVDPSSQKLAVDDSPMEEEEEGISQSDRIEETEDIKEQVEPPTKAEPRNPVSNTIKLFIRQLSSPGWQL